MSLCLPFLSGRNVLPYHAILSGRLKTVTLNSRPPHGVVPPLPVFCLLRGCVPPDLIGVGGRFQGEVEDVLQLRCICLGVRGLARQRGLQETCPSLRQALSSSIMCFFFLLRLDFHAERLD